LQWGISLAAQARNIFEYAPVMVWWVESDGLQREDL
jgi:hypothetical protein